MKKRNTHVNRNIYIAGFILAVFISFIPKTSSADERDSIFVPHSKRKAIVISHRGANRVAPENTVPAIEKAIKFGADFVEIDVRTTKDGKLVLMHNSDVNGATNGKGAVRELTLEEIKNFDAGARFGSRYKDVKVPTIEEALAATKGKINIYLDWKDADPKVLSAALEKAGVVDNTVIYGGGTELALLQKLNPRIRPMPEVDSIADLKAVLSLKMDLEVVASGLPAFNKELADEVHKAGIKIFVDILSADTCSGAKKAVRDGADGVQTDVPDVIVKCLEKMEVSASGSNFDKAMSLFFKGNSWNSTDILNQNAKDNPSDYLSYSGLAFIHAQGLIDPLYSGTAEDALAAIKKAKELGPDNKWNHLALVIIAVSKYIRGDLTAFNSIEKEAKKAQEIDAEAGEANFILWLVNRFLKGDRTAADKYYDLAVKVPSKYINPHYLFHYSHSFFGTCEDAAKEAVIAHSEDPAAWETYVAWEKPDKGDPAEMALADCHYWKALKSDYMGGDDKDKETQLRETLKHVPGFMFAAGEFVNTLEKGGRSAEAEKLLADNHRNNPDSIGATVALASFYADKAKDSAKTAEVLSSIPAGFRFRPGPYSMLYYKKLAALYSFAGDSAKSEEMNKLAEEVKAVSLY